MTWNSLGTINLVPLAFTFFPSTFTGNPGGDTLRVSTAGPFRYRSFLLRLYDTTGPGQPTIVFSRRLWQTEEPRLIALDYPPALSEVGTILAAAARPWRWSQTEPPWSITLEYFTDS